MRKKLSTEGLLIASDLGGWYYRQNKNCQVDRQNDSIVDIIEPIPHYNSSFLRS